MSTRRAKQLIYATLYILIIFIVCSGIYFIFIRPFIIASAPLPCPSGACTPTSTAPIATGTVMTFVTSPNHYTFLVQATNQNANYAAQVLDYAIDLDNASGTVLQSIPEESFIYPSQNKYLAVLNQNITQPFDHASLAITGVSWLASSTIGAIPTIAPGQFALQNIQTGSASTTVFVGGQLANTSIATFGQVIIMVIFNDQNGNPIGVSQMELGNVGAGTINNFSVIYPAEPNINPALNQILVYALR